ncbi:MAG: hypothetical protein HY016_11340 [Nitrosomonadales bacterium]|nr:hypothetical protein [Nitrosomonadales bacterium]
MIKFPWLVIYSIIAFNITAFTVVLQLDWLNFNFIIAKIIAWIFTLAAWRLAYIKRHEYFIIK